MKTMANNAMMDALLEAETEVESQMVTHIANAVTSQHNVNSKLQEITTALAKVQGQVNTLENGNQTQARRQSCQEDDQYSIKWNYCWSHGYTLNNHSSSTGRGRTP